jgi:hypothetical protein
LGCNSVTVSVRGVMTLTTNQNREVYAEAPLALVALEIKFPSEASVKEFGTTSQKAFRDRLNAVGDWVIESSQLQQVEVSFGATAAQTIRSVNVPRLLTRNRATAVSFPPGAVTIPTISRACENRSRCYRGTSFARKRRTGRPQVHRRDSGTG